MRILQIVHHTYPVIGGIEQVVCDICDALQAKEIEQKIICLNEDAKSGDISCRRKETVHDSINGIEVIRCGSFAKVASQCMSFSYPVELKEVMEHFEPDCVIFHYPNPFLATFFMKYMKEKMKFIVFYHLDITKQKFLGKLFHGQTIKLLQRADRIIATSPNYINGSPYLNKVREKCSVISCCVDTMRLHSGTSTTDKAITIRERYKGKLICFTCGRHVPYKGLTYLIKASQFLDDSFQIVIGGMGELTNKLKQEAAGDERIAFLGKLTNNELMAYYAACDMYCFPSITKNEAFGLALAEAMYFGKPGVTFTIPGSGVNYVNLNGVTGIECPNGDSKAYAEALQKLADYPALREKYGKNARQRVMDFFTIEQFQQNLFVLIEAL